MAGCECDPFPGVRCLWDDFIVRMAGNGRTITMEQVNVFDMDAGGCDGCVLMSV